MKLWQGMLSGELNQTADQFNASFKIDQRMIDQDIEGSIAHAQMLGQTGILPQQDIELIINGLNEIKQELENNSLDLDPDAEDVHTFIENELTKRIGAAGKKLHTARSRNDQVSTDLRLNLRMEIQEIKQLLQNYINSMCSMAENNLETIMPGYTHLQAAQPVTFAHHISAYCMMALRDLERLQDCKKRLNSSPLGACALAGTSYPIDRQLTADLLDFDSVMQNSMDAVSDRDFVLELNSVLSIIAIHLSRQAEELIIWSSQPYGFVKISDDFSTGSSIMPQKKNPDMAELIRGKTGRVLGNLIQALTMIKGLPLAYAKDMQEDKESIFDSVDTIKICLEIMSQMLATMEVNRDKMLLATELGYLSATDLADYLVKKDIPFRDAHHLVAELVDLASKEGKTLAQLPLEAYREVSRVFEPDLYEVIDMKNIVMTKESLGGPAPQEVKRQIEWVKQKLKTF
ncbi:MAG: argininosuccinate lyase [Clostridiaceae bacterium]|jgi:argininosuccinate lyase|nr:argininosuccinate lyase [Bacillota bacterium]NLN51863.1 argininosuccinate lyase [Clostridiaceae bacterium]